MWEDLIRPEDQPFKIAVKVEKGDSLFLRMNTTDGMTIYSYYIQDHPKLFRFVANGKQTPPDTDYLNKLVAYTGESNQELRIGISGHSMQSMFYMGPAERISSPLLSPLHTTKRVVTDTEPTDATNPEGIPYPPDITAIQPVEKSDTIRIARSWKAAREQARKENKMIFLYYEPASCPECSMPAKEIIKMVSDNEYTYALDSFNQHIVFYQARDTERYLFRAYGITRFPAGIIMNKSLQSLILANKTALSSFTSDCWGSNTTSFYPQLRVLNDLTQLDPDKATAKELMDLISLCKDGRGPGVYAVNAASYDDNNRPYPCCDSGKLAQAWQLLATKHEIYDRPDAAIADVLMEHLDRDALLESVPGATDQWQPSARFRYFTRFYTALNEQQSMNEYSSLYKGLITLLANGFYYFRDEPAKIKALCAAGSELIAGAPAMAANGYPVLLHYLHWYGDSAPISAELQNMATAYCNQFINTKPQKVIAGLLEKGNKEDPYFSQGLTAAAAHIGIRSEEQETPQQTYTTIAATTLNSMAWHYYTHNLDAAIALPWINAALQLDPRNAYYIDTKAHLLYRTGKTQEAIKEQQHAIDAALDKTNPVFISLQELNKLLDERDKMNAGIL
jgi:hypothetical protein